MAEVVNLVDTEDLYDWETIDLHYDDDGVLVQRLTKFDTQPDSSFIGVIEKFVDGNLVMNLTIDNTWAGSFYGSPPGGQKNWLIKTVMYDVMTYDKLVVVRFDSPLDPIDGIGPRLNDEGNAVAFVLSTGYVDGGLVYKFQQDLVGESQTFTPDYNSDLKVWRSREWNYDQDGNLEAYQIVYDSGIVKSQFFTEGNKLTVYEDGEVHGEASSHDWVGKATVHDSDGELLASFKEDDDGDLHWLIYQDGELVLRADQDGAGNHNWFGVVRAYEDGNVVDKVYYNSDEEFLAETDLSGIFTIA